MGTTLPSPVTINLAIGPTSTPAISQNLSRQGLYVFNPSAVVIWICPATSQQSAAFPGGQSVSAAVGGTGSIAIQPQQGLSLGFGGMPPFTNGLNAISASGTNPLTIWEFLP